MNNTVNLPELKVSSQVDRLEDEAAAMNRVTAIARTAIPKPPFGVDSEDLAQEVMTRAIEQGRDPFLLSSSFVWLRSVSAARSGKFNDLVGTGVFINAWNALHCGVALPEAKGIISQAAQRRALNRFNASLDFGNLQKDVFGVDKPEEGTEMGDPSAMAEYNEIVNQLKELYETFPAEKREVYEKLVGMYIDGYSISEIAKELGLPLGTAKSVWNTFRIRAIVRLQDYGIEY
jgi:DNA-directed RNA polymerase specialized sigma24 family protein